MKRKNKPAAKKRSAVCTTKKRVRRNPNERTATRKGVCAECRGTINKGDREIGAKGARYHAGCWSAPSLSSDATSSPRSKRNGRKPAKKKSAVPAKKKNASRRVRRNPDEQTAAQRYEYFHGREPETVTDVTTPLKYHKTLSGIGKLVALVILNGKRRVTLGNFKGALLAQDKKGRQLYISGGDQSVNLADFGIDAPKDQEYLGVCERVDYHTIKDHLGDDGGDAIYQHKFSKRKPPIVGYDVQNKLLHFLGGGYTLPAEGIDG